MNATHATPWYLAEVTDAAGSVDPSWQPGRKAYVRLRAGLIDVRGAGGVFCRVTIRQAAARLRTVRDAGGFKVIVKGQAKIDREFDQWHHVRRAFTAPRHAA
jgi:hypothetical protein